MSEFKPKGYPSVSPYLVVHQVPKLIQFAKDVFGAKLLRQFDMPDGSVMHAEIQIDDSVVMLGEASEEYPAVPSILHVYVSNADEVFARAVKFGAEVIGEPKRKDGDQDRRGTFKDPCGNWWSVATQEK